MGLIAMAAWFVAAMAFFMALLMEAGQMEWAPFLK
jgi:hypothetical protein